MKNITTVRAFIWQCGVCLVLFFSGILQAQTQEKTLTGIVTTDSIPLMGVSVTIKDTDKGIITDIDGAYKIQVKSGDVLIYSHLGYEERSVQFFNQKEINIELQLDATALGTVEITGGYYSLDERTKTGNVAIVGRDQLDQQVIHAPLEALQGRVAGLEIETRTGLNGQAPLVKLRGQKSLRGDLETQPLYIIDGVPIDNKGLLALSSIYDGVIGLDPLSTLDPSLIESIEVLKDADATSIYGSRGANGVIIINTKRGKAGRTKFEIQGETGVSWVNKFMKLMNTEQYLEMRKEAFANDGMEPTETNAPDLLLWDQHKDTDWQKELIGHHAVFQKYQGTLSGGNQQTSFLLSGGFQKETTVFPGDFGFQSNNLLANINHRSLNNRLTVNTSFLYGYNKSNLFNAGLFILNGIRLAPNAPDLFNEEGDINWELDEYGNSTFTNPLQGIANPNTIRSTSLQWNGQMSYNILKNLQAQVNIGYNRLSQNDTELVYKKNVNPLYAATTKSTTNKQVITRDNIILEPQLNYRFSIGSHKLNALVGSTFQKNENTQQYFRGTGYFSESQVGNLALGEETNILRDIVIDYRYAAVYGRLGYSYENKYHINFTGRRDGSSRFGEKNRFGNFGAIGAAWDFYKEDFIINSLPWISYGKLRGSYGSTGNDNIGDYQYRDTYSNISVRSGSLSIGGLVPSKLHNPYYSWEKNTKLEMALEIGFWDERAQIAVNWYKEGSGNQLVGLPLPSTAGFNTVQGNLPATIQNTGLDIQLELLPILKNNFKWNSSITLTAPKNKLIDFPDLESSSYASQFEIGKSLGIRKLYHYTGIDPNTGKYTFEDTNKDGVLNIEDQIITKDFSAKFYGGWQNSFHHKNWGLSFFIQFTKQKLMSPLTEFGTPGDRSNMPAEILDSWKSPESSSKYQAYTQIYDAGFYKYMVSDANIVDASFIRMKSISLTYQIPSEFSTQFGIYKGQIYLNGQNLFTITPYKGLNPQSGTAIDLPALTSINLGLKLTL